MRISEQSEHTSVNSFAHRSFRTGDEQQPAAITAAPPQFALAAAFVFCMGFLRSLLCCAPCCRRRADPEANAHKPKARKTTEQSASEATAPPAASTSAASVSASASATASAFGVADAHDEEAYARRPNGPLALDSAGGSPSSSQKPLSSDARPLVTDAKAISAAAASASDSKVDASVPVVRVFEAVSQVVNGGDDSGEGVGAKRDATARMAQPSEFSLRGESLSDISEGSEVELPHTSSEDPFPLESLESLGTVASYYTAHHTDSYVTAPSILDERSGAASPANVNTVDTVNKSISMSENMQKSITQSESSSHTLIEKNDDLAGRAPDPEGAAHLPPPPKRTPPGNRADEEAAANTTQTTKTQLSTCESGERRAAHAAEPTVAFALDDTGALTLSASESMELGDMLQSPSRKALLKDVGKLLQKCSTLTQSETLLPIREIHLESHIALNRNRVFILNHATTRTDSFDINVINASASQNNRICFLSHVSSHMCPALHQLPALTSAAIHLKLVPLIEWELVTEAVPFSTRVTPQQMTLLAHSPPVASNTELAARATHRVCAIREAPATASESFSRKAELATTKPTETLELPEELADSTAAPDELLEMKLKQPPAAAAPLLRGPFDATHCTSTSDVAMGNVEELEPRPEQQALAIDRQCAQRSPERRCALCTQTYCWMSAGRLIARDGDDLSDRETQTKQPEAPREPQTHPKRQHLLPTRCTPAVRECVTRVRSSQVGPADDSNSAATTSADREGTDAGLRTTWSEIEPVATLSANAAPPPATRVATKPAATSDQVR